MKISLKHLAIPTQNNQDTCRSQKNHFLSIRDIPASSHRTVHLKSTANQAQQKSKITT